MNRKTLFYIIITVIISATAAVLVWYFIFSPSKPQEAIQPGPGLVVPSEEKVKQLSINPTLWAFVSPAQNKIFWHDYSGQLWSSGFDGADAKVTALAPIENMVKVIWSPDGSKNLLALGTNQKDIRYIFLDPVSSVSNFLRNNIKTAAFSPDGKKIAYQVIDDSQNINTLFTADPDGKNQKTVVQLKLQDVVIAWPQTNLVSFTSKPSGLIGGNLWVLDTRTLIFDKLIDNLNGLETLWSQDGQKVLFSSTNNDGKNPRLAVMDLKGVVKDLGVPTIAKKCAWASNGNAVYCAVPQSWPQGTVLPDDYYKDAFLTADDIVKISTDSGQKETVISPVSDGHNLIVSSIQDFFIFVSKSNQRLYRVNLK